MRFFPLSALCLAALALVVAGKNDPEPYDPSLKPTYEATPLVSQLNEYVPDDFAPDEIHSSDQLLRESPARSGKAQVPETCDEDEEQSSNAFHSYHFGVETNEEESEIVLRLASFGSQNVANGQGVEGPVLPENSAFREHRIPEDPSQSGASDTITWRRLDFGKFGASQMELKFKSAGALSKFHGQVSIKVGDAQRVFLPLTNSRSTEDNVLKFDLKTLSGTQDVLLSLPSELSKTDLVSINFDVSVSKIDPKLHYVVAWDPYAKVLTVDAASKIGYVKGLATGLLQKIRFETVMTNRYKILLSDTNEALEFQVDNANEHFVIAKPPSSSLSQVWDVENNANGWIIISKFNGKKCLTVAKSDEKTPVTLQTCDGKDWQTWDIHEFP